jgi:hypothetical protein
MAAHMARTDRRRRWGFLLIALGLGVATFALIDGDPGSDVALDSDAGRSVTSSPTVLGSTITAAPAPTVPTAGAAAPATFELTAPPLDVRRTTVTTRPRRPTRIDGPTAPTTTSTTSPAPPPTLAPPWSIENTTTTTTEATTTTTTEDPTSTTTSTTSVPAGT